MKNSVLAAACVCSAASASAQNLLLNPDPETTDPTASGWTAINPGSDCYASTGGRVAGNQNGFPAAQTGAYFFYPGCLATYSGGEVSELYQDVDVSAYAAQIDAGSANFNFSGYTQSYNQSFTDVATITVEYRNAGGTVLSTYSTGPTTNTAGWVQYSDARMAPAGTRTIRVRLIGISNNGSSLDAYFDDLVLSTPIVLPVRLGSFTIVQQGNKAVLQWSTTWEQHNKGFFIERLVHGQQWTTVGFVPANNNGKYRFEEPITSLTGKLQYRLWQIDGNGRSTYTAARSLLINAAPVLRLYPNPASEYLWLQSPAPVQRLRLYDAAGNLVQERQNQNRLSLKGLAPGVYLLQATGAGYERVLQFVKQ